MNDDLYGPYFDQEEYQRQQYNLAERALSDARDFAVIELEAYAEDYDRDWSTALHDHDWRYNRCTGHDLFNARCNKRTGHRGRHDATFNGTMQFVYSEEKIANLLYTDNPLLALVPR